MSNEAKIKITADSSSAIQNIEKLFAAILKIGEDAKLSSEQMQALASVLNATKEVFLSLEGVIKSNTENIKANKEENKKLTDAEKEAEKQKERLKQAVQNLAAGMGGSIGQFFAFVQQLREASKEGSKTEVALLALTGIMNVLNSGYARVTKAIQGNAEEGDKYSQAIIGAQNHIEMSTDDLIQAFTKGLAPAIAGISQVLVPLIERMKTWLETGKGSTEVGVLMVKAFNGVIATVNALDYGFGAANRAWVRFKNLFTNNPDLKLLGDLEKQQAESTAFFEKIQADLYKLEDRLKDGIGFDDLLDKEIAAGRKGTDFIRELNDLLTEDTEASHSDRLKIIQDFRSKYESELSELVATTNKINKMQNAERVASAKEANESAREQAKELGEIKKEAIEKQNELTKELIESEKEELKSAMDLELSDAKDNADKKLEILAKYQDDFNALYYDDLGARTAYQIEMNDLEKQSHEDWLEGKKERVEAEIKLEQEKNEAIQAAFEERLALIDIEGGTEEQISRKKIALYQSVSKAAGASAALRKKVELDLLTEQKKINTSHEKQYADYAKKISATVSGALNQMIFEHKSFNEVVGGLIKEFAMKAVATFVEMASTAIAKDLATAGSAVVASGIKKSAQSATVASGIASWTSLLGPIGPAVYSTYLSIYKGLITGGEATLEHEEGGPLGRVPGFGRSDSFGFTDKANSQEFILNERGRKAFGDEALSYANETGANPFNSMGGSGDPDRVLGTLKIVVELRNMLTPADDVARAVAPAISKALSQHVIFNNGTLIASKTK